MAENIWADKRSWVDGMTAFFGVHLVLVIVSLALGTIIGGLGIRALRRGASGTSGQPKRGQSLPRR